MTRRLAFACWTVAAVASSPSFRASTSFLPLLTLALTAWASHRPQVGALTEFLGQKVTLVQSLAGERMQMIVHTLSLISMCRLPISNRSAVKTYASWRSVTSSPPTVPHFFVDVIGRKFISCPTASLALINLPSRSGIISMFIFGDYRVACAMLGLFPILIVVNILEMQAAGMGTQAAKTTEGATDEQTKSAGSLVGEIVSGIRTVASFNAEHRFFAAFAAHTDAARDKAIRRKRTAALVQVGPVTTISDCYDCCFRLSPRPGAGLPCLTAPSAAVRCLPNEGETCLSATRHDFPPAKLLTADAAPHRPPHALLAAGVRQRHRLPADWPGSLL